MDINFQPALLPPGMKDLKNMVVTQLKRSGEMLEGDDGKKRTALATLMEKKSTTKIFLLGMLAVLKPTSKIFRQPSLPENCSIVDVSTVNDSFHAIFSGGFTLGQAQGDAVGFAVTAGEQNALKTYSCQFLKDLGNMVVPRFMHQSVVLHSMSKVFTLLAIGGKSGPMNWTNTCESLDLGPFFKEGAKEEKEGVGVVKVSASWKEVAPMKHARSNFAAIAIGDAAYVFGGICGTNGHRPDIASDVIERYTSRENKWEVFDIPMAPSLAAFSWA